MTITEIILILFFIVNIFWNQLTILKINRIQKTLFQMKYKKAIPIAKEGNTYEKNSD